MSGQREYRFAGSGGQGLILAGRMLADALVREGRRVAQSQTYEPTSRGGYCNADLVLAYGEVDYPLATALDVLVLLEASGIEPSWGLLQPGSLVIADARLCPTLPEPPDASTRILHLPLTRTAIDLGSERSANIVALGALLAVAQVCDAEVLREAVRAQTPRGYVDLNLAALAAGARLVPEPKVPAGINRDGVPTC